MPANGIAIAGTKSNVSGATSSTTLLAANLGRTGATFYNDSAAILYLDATGGTASSSSYTIQMAPNGYYELPVGPNGPTTSLITGIWVSATGAVRVTEFA